MTKSWLATIIWMALAAVTSVEAYVQYHNHGIAKAGFWLFSALCLFCVVMFFRSRVQRSKDKKLR